MIKNRKGLTVIELMITLAIIMVISFTGFVKADDYTITASTYPVTEATTIGAQISGKIQIDKIILSSDGSTDQTITIYELGSSTTTVSARLTYDLNGEGAQTIDFPYYNAMRIEDFCVRKSTTGTNVRVYVLTR